MSHAHEIVPIGEAARQSGCAASTIRFYEEIGLVRAARRSQAGRRHYAPDDIAQLVFIRRARDFGMSIDQIRGLLAQTGADQCQPARTVLADRLAQVRARHAELLALENTLAAMLARCDVICATAPGCSILSDIATPMLVMPERATIG